MMMKNRMNNLNCIKNNYCCEKLNKYNKSNEFCCPQSINKCNSIEFDSYQSSNKCCSSQFGCPQSNNRSCNNDFCCTQSNRDNNMEQMKLDLQAHDFAIEDLSLYLDTHPEDMRAVCLHNEYAKKYRKISDEYQKVYGPLSILFPCNSWRWIEEPWPWHVGNSSNISQEFRNDVSELENDFDLKGGIK